MYPIWSHSPITATETMGSYGIYWARPTPAKPGDQLYVQHGGKGIHLIVLQSNLTLRMHRDLAPICHNRSNKTCRHVGSNKVTYFIYNTKLPY